MHYNDAARSRLANTNQPMYPAGRPVAVLPALHLFPTKEDSTVRVAAMLATSHNSFSWFHTIVPAIELPKLYTEWLDNPEEFMHERLGWPGVSAPPPPPDLSNISLEDLGLN